MYFPALLDGALGPLAARLGSRATLDDPRVGRASGLPAIEVQLKKSAEWLSELGATYERGQFTTGIDRDVTEGTLRVKKADENVEVPVAVVAERRRSREVELRVYYHANLFAKADHVRAPYAVDNPSVALPSLVIDYLAARKRGDSTGALACFEENGVLRDSAGCAYGRANDTLRAFLEKSEAREWQACGYADDGRTCALEYTLVRHGAQDVPPAPGLAVFERGDSGLFRAIRVYE